MSETPQTGEAARRAMLNRARMRAANERRGQCPCCGVNAVTSSGPGTECRACGEVWF